MEIMNLTSGDVQRIAASNNIVGLGSNGIVYQIDDDTLFKFNYKKFIDCFSVDITSIKIRELNDISKSVEKWKEIDVFLNKGKDDAFVEQLKSLMKKQSDIHLTDFPKGLVYVDGYCVGSLIKYHKEYVNLYDYLQHNEIEKDGLVIVEKKLNLAVEELISNYIYHSDFTLRNVMYNPETHDVQIIDFEDAVYSLKKQNKNYENNFRNLLKDNIDFLKRSFQNAEEKTI